MFLTQQRTKFLNLRVVKIYIRRTTRARVIGGAISSNSRAMQGSPESNALERSVLGIIGSEPYKLSPLPVVHDIHVAAARRSITSDLSRVWAAGGIISAMPAVISSSRGATEIAAGGRLPGLQTPRNIYIYSHYCGRYAVRNERRRHVSSCARPLAFALARTRLRYATRAERFAIKLSLTPCSFVRSTWN